MIITKFKKGRIGIRCVENGNCKLEEIFHEVECTLRGHPCGPNMQLAIANLSKALEGGTLKCTMKCQCAYGYTEENNQCIRITVDFVSLINTNIFFRIKKLFFAFYLINRFT